MGRESRNQVLIRTGALGDALLTVPLVTQLAECNPDSSVVWYQSPWTCELPWKKILPPSISGRVQVCSFECEIIAALFGSNLSPMESYLRNYANIDIIDVALQKHGLLAKNAARYEAAYHWIPAPTSAIQKPPHAAKRLCLEQNAADSLLSEVPTVDVARSIPLRLYPQSVDLQHPWLVNPVGESNRIERRTLVHAGAGSRRKQMPIDRWVALAQQRRGEGLLVAYLLGPAEIERGMRQIIEAADPGAEILTPALRDLPEVIGAAGEFWGHDSGPSHLAGMMGIHTQVFFGPTNPEVWHPLGPRVKVHRF